MKQFLLALVPLAAVAQGGWTKMTDPSNPVTTFTGSGIYKGAAWVDVNNDGNTDLFAMPHFLFLNNGAGSFVQQSGTLITTSHLQLPGGCSWGDLDNDGLIDFITAQNPSEIYLNKGDGTFENKTSSVPSLANSANWGCALADINNDNKLDLLYAHANGFHGAAVRNPCKLFIRDASGFTFTPKKGYYFTDSLRPYTVPYFHDYDLDGDMDVFIASGPGGSPGPDYCYRNMKKETGMDTLYEMTAEPWMNQLQDGQCYNFIDYDNDGDLDMCLTNYAGAPNRFYRNDGNGSYSAVAAPFINTGAHLANNWGDFDNDGDQDVLIAADNAISRYYENKGNGVFVQLSATLAAPAANSCIVNCDYDNDGDLDVFIHGDNNGRVLYRNDTVAAGRNWVNYHLKGTISNTSAIGAVVKIKATINGISTWQLRTITAQNSFQGQNDLRVHFGLNDAAIIDSLLFFWPSGINEYYTGKPANQFETLIEGNGSALGVNTLRMKDQLKVVPNPANDQVTISFSEKSGAVSLKIMDSSGKIVHRELLTTATTKIDISELISGTYLFVAENKGVYSMERILIQR